MRERSSYNAPGAFSDPYTHTETHTGLTRNIVYQGGFITSLS